MAETPTDPNLPATKADVREAAAGDRLVSWVSSGTAVFVGGGMICTLLLGGMLLTVDRAEAAGSRGAMSVIEPVKTEQAFLKQQVLFIIEEQRETRRDIRTAAEPRVIGVSAEFRAMAPLPSMPDAGR